jgi:hypothetical protein
MTRDQQEQFIAIAGRLGIEARPYGDGPWGRWMLGPGVFAVIVGDPAALASVAPEMEAGGRFRLNGLDSEFLIR